MKLIAIIMTTFLLQVSAAGFAQKVTLKERNAELQSVLQKIRIQTGYDFLFDFSVIENAKKVNVEINNLSIDKALDELFKDQNLSYSVKDKSVVIKVKRPSFLDRVIDRFAAIDVKGRVVDENGNPLPGASVKVKGVNKVTKTDAKGEFYLQGVDEDAVLQISYLGYKTQEIGAGSSVGTIKLELGNSELEEVTVSTGYWTTTNKMKTGSISKITAKDIENQPVTSPLMALQGRVPGLDITPTSGMPGSAVKIQIRGQNSLRPGDFPLYVIDGVPIDSRPFMAFTTVTGNPSSMLPYGNDPLRTIDPNSIESIEVLKDADATAIYGSRGANGVILITTKKPKTNEDLSANVSTYHGVGQIANRLDLLNREQYLAMRREAFKNDNLSPEWYDYDLGAGWDTTKTTDWQDVLLGGTSNITDVSAGLSNGGQQTSFNLNMSYHKESLIMPGDFGSTQLSGRFSLYHRSNNNRLTLALSTQYAQNKTMYGGDQNLVNLALILAPHAPALYNADGSLNWQIISLFNDTYITNSWENPFGALLNTTEMINNNFLASASLKYNLFSDLTIAVNSGLTSGLTDDFAKLPIAATSPTTHSFMTGFSNFSGNQRSTWNIEPSLNYRKILADHSFSAVLGATIQQNRSEFNNVGGSGYTSDALLKSIQSAPFKSYLMDDELYRYMAAYARVGYDYKSKYLLNFTGRRDGSSRFGPGKRVSNFGSIGAAWIISEENFLRNSSTINFAKIRGSLGVTGSENIGSYQFLETYNIASYFYQGFAVLNPTSLYNNNLAWEKTKKTELALELGLFDNAISIEAAAYRNTSSNQLVSYGLPGISGFSSVNLNLDAVIQNAGLEFSIITKNMRSSHFQWTSSANLSLPRNKLVRYDGIEQSSYNDSFKVGEPLSIQRLLKWNGVDPVTGEHTFEDTNGDGSITDNDKVFMKPLARKFYGGINNTFAYKNFELSFLFQFSKATQSGFLQGPPGEVGNQSKWVLERWQENKSVTDVAKFSTIGYQSFDNLRFSDYNTRDTWFVRLKTLSINYKLSASLLQSVRLKSADIFLRAQNLFTLTNYKLVLDPETETDFRPCAWSQQVLLLNYNRYEKMVYNIDSHNNGGCD